VDDYQEFSRNDSGQGKPNMSMLFILIGGLVGVFGIIALISWEEFKGNSTENLDKKEKKFKKLNKDGNKVLSLKEFKEGGKESAKMKETNTDNDVFDEFVKNGNYVVTVKLRKKEYSFIKKGSIVDVILTKEDDGVKETRTIIEKLLVLYIDCSLLSPELSCGQICEAF